MSGNSETGTRKSGLRAISARQRAEKQNSAGGSQNDPRRDDRYSRQRKYHNAYRRRINDRQNITVITNSLPAAFALSENKDITLVVCGGTVRHKTRSMHGSIAERSLQDINADLMFVGADGIDAVNGITTFNEGYSVSGAMVTAANKVIAVLDSSKFNRRGFNQVLPIEKIDIIITDDAVSEVDKLALQKTRVKLITV